MVVMANLNKAVSFIVSHQPLRNKFKGSIITHSSLVSLSKSSSSLLAVGTTGICPRKTILAPFYTTLCSNHSQNLFNDRPSILFEDTYYARKVFEPTAVYEDTTEVIEQLCNFGLINSAIALLEELDGIGCKPDVVKYPMVIDSVIKARGQEIEDNASRCGDRLGERKVIDSLCNFGLLDSAIGLLEELLGIGCRANVITYTIVFDSVIEVWGQLGGRKREENAAKLLEMAFHHGIEPNASFLLNSSLLNAIRILSRGGDHAYRILKDMEDKGIYADFTMYIIYVDAYCREGRVEDAERILNLILRRRGHLHPNAIMLYRWVIEGYCLQGKMSKSKEVFDSMRRRDEQPNVAIYNSLINGYFKDSKIEEAMHLFHQMMQRHVEYDSSRDVLTVEFFHMVPLPDERTYEIVLESLCNNNQVEEAVSLFQSMGLVDKNFNPNVGQYNILIDRASKSAGKLSIARSLYNDMTIIKGLQPNDVTYAAMIYAFCEEGLVGEAKELFLEMKEKGFFWPDHVTCIKLVLRSLKNKQRDIVEMLLLEMEGRVFGIDASTIERMLSEDGPFSS